MDGADKSQNKTPPRSWERNKESCETEHDAIVEIPSRIRVGIVGIEPAIATIVTLDIEHVRVTIRVGPLCIVSSKPPHPENLSIIRALNIIRDL